MEIDIPHIVGSVLLVAATIYAVDQSGYVTGVPKMRRAAFLGGAVFMVMLLFNLVWPYGA